MADDDRAAAIEQRLIDAERAHGRYEAEELNGVFDQNWAQWYAEHAVELGIGEAIGRAVSAEELGSFLAAAYADYQAADPPPAESWAAHLARRIATELA